MAFSISLSHLSWSAPNRPPLFYDVNLSFREEKTGLIGRNGVGKTTLLRLIASEIQPQAGHIFVSGKVGTLRQEVQVPIDATVADLFGVTAALAFLQRAEQGILTETELSSADWTLETRIASSLGQVGISAEPYTRLAQMSGGQLTRVRLAALLFAQPDFLLLDEPTNNLDRPGRAIIIDVLSSWKSGAIVVSHDRELLESMDAIVELTTVGVTRYGGNWSDYREQKTLELTAARRELADAQKRIADVERSAQATTERHARASSQGRKAKAKGGTPHIIQGMRKDRSEKTGGENARLAERRRDEAIAAAAAARETIEVLQPLTVTVPPTQLSAHKVVLKLNGVTFGHVPGEPIIRDFSLQIMGPERVAIAGPNGSGKSTLLALIAKSIQPWQGSVEVATPFALLDQKMSLLDRSLSIRENFLRMNPDTDEQACRAALARFMFRADAALQVVSTLSGGQLLRAGLACVLGGSAPPPLLILDEPTNHLDREAIEAIEAGLCAYDGALLVVSHDESFLSTIGVTRRINLQGVALM